MIKIDNRCLKLAEAILSDDWKKDVQRRDDLAARIQKVVDDFVIEEIGKRKRKLAKRKRRS